MVPPKYLCSAPRPETWQHHADQVLPRLKAGAAAMLQQTIATLRSRHAVRGHGPGRKSNAEHAILFYEYLWARLKEEQEEERAEEEEMEDGSNEEEEESSRGNGNRQRAHGQSVESVKREEQALQSKERAGEAFEEEDKKPPPLPESAGPAQKEVCCQVCEQFKEQEQGLLFACSTCDHRFHVGCVRPILEDTKAPPPNDYVCAYCVLASGEPKHTVRRRQAAAAVRLMARLHNKLERERRAASQLAEQPVQSPRRKVAPPAAAAASSSEEQDQKQVAATPERSGAATLDAPPGSEDSAGRSKRPRKQPTLYDPQLCAARQWQSDELAEFQASIESSDDDDDSSSSSSSSSERKGSSRDPGSVFCGFCQDDKAMEICCFCACRVCFGKGKASKLLICDACEDEYHTFCLQPPLKGVPPKSQSWFCPSCAALQAKRNSKSAAITRITGTRAASSTMSSSPTRTSSRSLSPKASSPRTGGRSPTKPTTKLLRDKSGKFASKGGEGSPRKRGWPPSQSPSGKKRRRRGSSSNFTKRKSTSPAAAAVGTAAANKSDRHKTPTSGAASTGSAGSSSSVKISRSGRPVKRSAFHDEIPEFDQHLKKASPPTTTQHASASPRQQHLALAGRAAASAKSSTVSSTAGSGKLKAAPPSSGHTTVRSTSSRSMPTAQVSVAAALAAANRSAAARMAAAALTPLAAAGRTDAASSSSQAAAAALPHWMVHAPTTSTSSTRLLSLPVGSFSAASTTASASAVRSAVTFPGSSTGVASSAAALHSLTGIPSVDGPVGKESAKQPRRKPGARECMQISRRFGAEIIPEKYMEILLDYCTRGKVEHLIRMRERLDEHARFLELQLAGLEAKVKENGESDVVVPPMPLLQQDSRKMEQSRKGP